MTRETAGKLIIVSGPSGSGKTTVLKEVFVRCPRPLVASVSATTRCARPGEVDGVDYHFLEPEEFARKKENGEFLESFEVFGGGCWYGTLAEEVTSGLAAGNWVVLEIDVQGTLAVLEQYPEAVSIFLRPSTLEQLETRLRGRGTESEESIGRRLEVAQREWSLADRYQYEVINDDVDLAVEQIRQILTRLP